MGTSQSEFEDADADTLGSINIAMGAFSFVGSTFILASVLKFRALRSFAYKLIACVALSDWLNAIGNMMGDAGGRGSDVDSHRPECQFQALLISYFELTSVLWSAAIAYTLHQAFLREDPQYSGATIDSRAVVYHGVIWGFALAVTLLPLSTDSYGDTGAWCWIVSDQSAAVAWRFLQFYLPLWFCIGYSAYVYIAVVRKMRQLFALAQVSGGGGGDPSADEKQHNVYAMKFYPLVMVVCYFWATANRLYQTFGGGLVLWLNGLHVFFAAAQGVGNFLVFVSTAQVQQQFRLFLYPYFSCIRLLPQDSQSLGATAGGAAGDEQAHGPGAAAVAAAGGATPRNGGDANASASIDMNDGGGVLPAPMAMVGSSAERNASYGFHSVDNAIDAARLEHDAPLPEPVVPAGPLDPIDGDGDAGDADAVYDDGGTPRSNAR